MGEKTSVRDNVVIADLALRQLGISRCQLASFSTIHSGKNKYWSTYAPRQGLELALLPRAVPDCMSSAACSLGGQ